MKRLIYDIRLSVYSTIKSLDAVKISDTKLLKNISVCRKILFREAKS